ncbi:MAG: hypothetical protein NC079_04225 [Clostridium sp.]|nr:hypothetical protein [Acetatifactor muris]MCM1526741.1 hypothetical protein [Bacteroides sp.]MCM1562799.1 hypothetical protein [Clostridium sp.]
MWEGSYASEPFDLRLTALCMMRDLGRIALCTLLGTLIFGGGYYVKNVLLGPAPQYEMTLTCKLEYTDPPVQSGDYYINEMTWNTYLDSEEFRQMVELAQPFVGMDVTTDIWTENPLGLQEALSAAVASDIHVPSFTVSTPDADKTRTLCAVVREVLTGDFVAGIPEIASIRVLDESGPVAVYPDVRPLRAVILSALLSCFFTVTVWLLREIGADSIRLPATLRRRYGLKALGTVESAELKENAGYLFKNKDKIAVCAVDSGTDPQIVTESLQEKLRTQAEWIAVPAPLLCPESAEILRDADAVLLVVEAGLHAGKPLERVLEFLKTQDIAVTATLLWNADEALIRAYYRLGR